MDEKFVALDTFNRYHLQDELIRLQQQEQLSILLVTHDIDEAVYLSDRIYIMSANPGRIFEEIYIDLPKPRNRSHQDFQYRSEDHTSELQSRGHLVCRLLLEKKNTRP